MKKQGKKLELAKETLLGMELPKHGGSRGPFRTAS